MDIFGSLLGGVVNPFIANPAVQSMALGLLVKWSTDRLKGFLKKVDENGVPDGYKVPLQLVVMVCTAVATMADLALKGQLQTFPIDTAVSFVTVALPTYLNAMGIHFGAKVALKELEKKREDKENAKE